MRLIDKIAEALLALGAGVEELLLGDRWLVGCRLPSISPGVDANQKIALLDVPPARRHGFIRPTPKVLHCRVVQPHAREDLIHRSTVIYQISISGANKYPHGNHLREGSVYNIMPMSGGFAVRSIGGVTRPPVLATRPLL